MTSTLTTAVTVFFVVFGVYAANLVVYHPQQGGLNPICRLPRRGRRGQSCKTKPIPGGSGWDEAARTWDAGANVQNEANFRPSGRHEGVGIPSVCRTHPHAAKAGNPLPGGRRCL